MIRNLTISLAVLASATAIAQTQTDTGIYGQLDLKGLPKPEVIQAKAVKANSSLMNAFSRTIYIHVRPGDEEHWARHCKQYDACGSPVLFVTENWFVNVYLPAIGAFDGREQRYREQMGRRRPIDADRRYDAHPD
jgi:hypothetical protein